MNPVIMAVDMGHIGSDLDNNGQVTENSKCKRDGQPWPCSTVQGARQKYRRIHGVKEVKS